MILSKIPRINLGSFPTPISRLDKLSQQLENTTIFIKRDDMPFVSLGGNKIRKLEFLMADVIGKKADVIVTTGGTQSNWAQLTTVVAATHGVDSVLLLEGTPNAELQGNYLIDRIAGAEVRWITESAYSGIDKLLEGVADELRSRGRRPYVISIGGSTPLGDIGYVLCGLEIVEQAVRMGVDFDHVIITTGSGGTTAGLVLGLKMFNPSIRVTGFSIARSKEELVPLIVNIANESAELIDTDVRVKENDFDIVEDYIGDGYASKTEESINAIKLLLRTEGILLDPIYTGKAFAGMLAELKKGRFKKGSNILFVHTGGYGGVFGFSRYFA